MPAHVPRRAGVLLVHAVPGRIRLRVNALRARVAAPELLAQALNHSALVQSFRINPHCGSVTVFHVGQACHIVQLVTLAVVNVDAAVLQQRRIRAPMPSGQRLVWCSVANLALLLLPEPVAPATVVVRLAASALIKVVEIKTPGAPSKTAQWLDRLALVVSLARADSFTRALLGCLMRRLLQPVLH